MSDLTIVQDDLLATIHPVIAHCCNTRNAMNSGVARAIRQRFPEVYVADTRVHSEKGEGLLGHCELVPVITEPDSTMIKMIANLYGQKNYGYEHARYIDYEAFYTSLNTLKHYMECAGLKGLALPYKIGAGLAGGDWAVIEAMIRAVIHASSVKVFLYRI